MSFTRTATAMQIEIQDPMAKYVLIYLTTYENAQTGLCFPSIATICKDSSLSRSTVIRKIQDLVDLGHIKKIQTKSSNQYKFMFGSKVVSYRHHTGFTETPKHRSKSNDVVSQVEEVLENWKPTDDLKQSLKEMYGDIDHDTEVPKFIKWCGKSNKEIVSIPSVYKSWCSRVKSFASADEARRRTSIAEAGKTPTFRKQSGASISDAIRSIVKSNS